MADTKEQVTNASLARMLGCHPSTISRWRNNDRLPGVENLHLLSVNLDIPYSDLKHAWDGGKKKWGFFVRTRIFGERE